METASAQEYSARSQYRGDGLPTSRPYGPYLLPDVSIDKSVCHSGIYEDRLITGTN